jgi:hypothetical protein
MNESMSFFRNLIVTFSAGAEFCHELASNKIYRHTRVIRFASASKLTIFGCDEYVTAVS